MLRLLFTNRLYCVSHRLKELFERGLPYVEAYATVLLLKNSNPNVSSNKILDRALELKPHLEKEVREASKSLLS